MKLLRLSAVFLSFILIASCGIFSVGGNYKKPKTKMPKNWIEAKNSNSLENNEKSLKEIDVKENQWWKNFDDPVLNKIIKKAIANNYDYKIAQSKVIEARANLTSATSDLFPKSNLKSSAQRGNNYFNFFNEGSKNQIVNFFSVGFDSSWEIDLFGANKSSQEAAKALFEASEESRNYILTSIIAEVAKNYVQFREAQNQLFVKQQINKIYEEILKLDQEKQKAGMISEVDSSKAEIILINNKSEISALEAKVEILRYNLENLLNCKAGSMKKILQKSSEVPLIKKNIIIDAPVSLLQNRPDIKQSERELAATFALKKYAFAQVFPKISLTNFLGFNNTQSGNVFQSSSKVFSVGASASMPVLNFGGVIAGYKISKEREKRAFLSYKNKVNNAIVEVESAMVDFLKEDENLVLKISQLQLSQKVLDLNLAKYQSGIISNSDYLKSQIDFLNSEEKLILSSASLSIKTIALYKSLGGSWISN